MTATRCTRPQGCQRNAADDTKHNSDCGPLEGHTSLARFNARLWLAGVALPGLTGVEVVLSTERERAEDVAARIRTARPDWLS